MKMILFDLGNTLEDSQTKQLLPGARETLTAIQAMRDNGGNPPLLALVSDFGVPPATPQQTQSARLEYIEILDGIGIREFFEPVAERITLSLDAGALKPSWVIFRAALRNASRELRYKDVMFITEMKSHVTAARALRIKAVHFKGPGQINGDVQRLVDLIPLVRNFVTTG